MKRRAKGEIGPRASTRTDALQQAIDRTVEYVRRMTPEQLKKSLIDAGVLTRSGRLAARYRQPKCPAGHSGARG